MMDERISADLAIVARTSRARPRSVETTLRDIATRANVGTRDRDVSASLAIGPIYAARMARIVAGSIVLVSIVALTLMLAFVRVTQEEFQVGIGIVTNLLDRTPRRLEIAIGCAAVLGYVIAWRVAQRRSERIDRARVDRLDRMAMMISVAAPVCFVLFFALVRTMIGKAIDWDTEEVIVRMVVLFDDPFLKERASWDLVVRDWAAWIYAPIVVGSVAGGLLASLASRVRHTVLFEIGAVWMGLMLLPYGSMPSEALYDTPYIAIPSKLHRSLALHGCSVLLLVASAALLLRRREIRALDGE